MEDGLESFKSYLLERLLYKNVKITPIIEKKNYNEDKIPDTADVKVLNDNKEKSHEL